MNDTIDRQAAIDAICNACGKIDCDKMDKCEKLQLPPANCSEIPNNSDTISRQAAIEALRAMQTYKLFAGDDMLLIDQAGAQTELMMLPPAQPKLLQPWEVLVAQAVLPQPKMGKWIYHIDDLFPAESTMECNQCHAEQPLTCDDEFCPHCGAKMEVTE